MKYNRLKFKVLLPLILLSIMMVTKVAYADVSVHIKGDKTEAYSHNASETVNVNIKDEPSVPLDDEADSYKSDVDNDNYNSEVDDDSYNSKVDEDYNYDRKKDVDDYYEYEGDIAYVSENEVPVSDSSKRRKSSKIDEEEEDDIDYAAEHYAEKLKKGATYEILNKDMVVQKNVVYDDNTSIGYGTIEKGSKVELIGFVTQGNKKMVEVMTDNDKIYYEDVENFYHNAQDTKASSLDKYKKGIYNDAMRYGTEKGYNRSVILAILLMLGAIFCVKFLDSTVFRLKNPDGGTTPYLNSIARVMPGAMIGSFIIISKMFDKNAVDYFFYGGFSFIGENYKLIHWLLQAMIIMTIYMLVRIVIEGVKCFTIPCMLIRTAVLFMANLASFYLCYGLSYVGVAVYILLVLYQCICVDSYGCADIAEESSDEEGESEGKGEGEESGEGGGDSEPEPEAS